MLSFEIAKLDEIAVHFNQAGLAALMRTLAKLNDRSDGAAIVLEIAKGDCPLSANTPFGEDAVQRVILSRHR